MKKQVTLRRISSPSFADDFESPKAEWFLCGEGLNRFYDIPADVKRIYLCLSDKYVEDAYKAKVVNGYDIRVRPTPGAKVSGFDIPISFERSPEWAKAAKQGYVYVWVEIDA